MTGYVCCCRQLDDDLHLFPSFCFLRAKRTSISEINVHVNKCSESQSRHFGRSKKKVCKNEPISFYNNNPGYATYLWDFGDGTTGTGSTAYHSYTTSGIFNVCVTITDSTGWQICSNCTTVVDSFNTFNCNILFSPMGQNTFLFSVPSNPSASGYVWDFGDGTTGSGNNVQHTYAAPGVYNVTVNVTGLGMI